MHVIGLISGTSIDAIDAALVNIERDGDALRLRLRAFAMLPWDARLRDRIRALLPPGSGSTAEVCEVNALVGEAFADAARTVAREAGIDLTEVDLIASHGQTVYHQIAPGTVRSTLQIGSPSVIAERTGCTIAADFRPRDMAAGGEGAPLVPLLDVLLFRDPDRHRALQNIGGIGNVTYLPPNSRSPASSLQSLAFDTGPGNVLIDEAVRLLTDGSHSFDRDGQMAAAGQIDRELLDEWMRHPFFHQPPPKSTGREAWGVREAKDYVATAQKRDLDAASIVATITALTARSIAHAYQRYLPRVDDALIAGGGARNPTLLAMLRSELPGCAVRPLDDIGLDADAKEAVAFALLGYYTLHGWPGNVPTATGATHPVVLGSLTPGSKYRALLSQMLAHTSDPPGRALLADDGRQVPGVGSSIPNAQTPKTQHQTMDTNEQQLEQSWIANAAAWTDAVRGGHIASRRVATDAAIVAAVAALPRGRLLDVGCGEGWLARELAERGFAVVGIDGSAPLIERARQSGGAASFHALRYDDLIAEPDRAGGPYNIAVCNFALLSESVTPLLRALRHCVDRGGRLVIQTVHPWAGRDGDYRDGWRTETFSSFGGAFSEPMPWYFRTLASWIGALKEAGWIVERCVEPIDPSTSRPLSLMLICVAEQRSDDHTHP